MISVGGGMRVAENVDPYRLVNQSFVIDGRFWVGWRLFTRVVGDVDPYRFLKNPFAIDGPIDFGWQGVAGRRGSEAATR